MSWLRQRPLVGLALLCLAQWAFLFAITTPAWDATFYYAYARSAVFDGDLHIDNDLRLSYPTSAPDFAAKGLDAVRTVTGRVASPFAIGSSLLWLPWLALLRLMGELGLLPAVGAAATGYEWPFTAVVATVSTLIGWLAFFVAFATARRETGDLPALASAATLLFATPLLYYLYREPLYSHAASAFVTSLVVYVWWRAVDRPPNAGDGLLLGLALGLAALVRWQHALYLALPLATAAAWWLRQPAEGRRPALWATFKYLALVGAAALALFSLQMAHWRLFYGTWLTVPQGEAFFDWRSSYLLPTLFSTYRGLLTWLPVFLPAVLGLVWLRRRRPLLATGLLLVLALELYVNSSTGDWFAGGGFGPRRFTSELAILVIGYAAFLRALPGRWRNGLALAGGLFLGLHQWTLLRFGLLERIGGQNRSMYPAFEWEDQTWGQFWSALAGHLPDLLRPLDFFMLPGSPLDLALRLGQFPGRHFYALGLALLLALAAVAGGRAALGRGRGPLRRRAFALAAVALLAANLWILVWA